MGESLTQRRRVRDEGLRVVNRCGEGRIPVLHRDDGTSLESTCKLRARSLGDT
jgi:hypothetical protein